MRVDEAFVISLPERADRLGRFMASLPADWPFPTPILHPGVREPGPAWFHSSDGAWGCRQAHLQLLASAWARGVESTLILEDDAVLCRHFSARWGILSARIPEHWSMVMLGGEHVEPPGQVGPHVVRCLNTRRTHAYIIRLRAIPLLMRTWSRARRHIDHALAEFQADTWTMAPSGFLIGQDSGWSDISRKTNQDVRFWGGGAEARTGLELELDWTPQP
jgi:hypothetical protein